MASADKELAEQLTEAGNAILDPPSSVDELLPLLDQVENCLSRVEQSPRPFMQKALAPSLKALVKECLFRHSDPDVNVAVAACISEITRITAPEAPYDDDKMKEVFQLIVSAFENLFDKSSRSYSKRASILETVAKVRSCVVMLDLECDTLINEMFQHFLKSIRDYHPEGVFTSMETIMTLVLEESEDISPELLSPLLASVKRDNEEVLPIARKLAECVLRSCASKLKPYLTYAAKKLGISMSDCSKIVSSICQEPSDVAEQNDVTASEPVVKKEIPEVAASAEQADITNENSPKSIVSNDIPQLKEDGTSNALKKLDEEQSADQPKDTDTPVSAQPETLATEKVCNTDSNVEQSTGKGEKTPSPAKLTEPSDVQHDEKEVEASPEHKSDGIEAPGAAHEEQPVDAAVSLENKKETAIPPPSPKETEDESAGVAFPTASEKVPDESHPKKKGRPKKKKRLAKNATPSSANVSKRTSEETSDAEGKPSRLSGKKVVAGKSSEDKIKKESESSDTEAMPNIPSGKKAVAGNSDEDKTKKESETASDSDATPVKQVAKKVNVSSNSADKSSSKQQEDKKKRSRGKALPEKDEAKTSTKTVEKETVASSKSAKQKRDESDAEETPKTGAKRKLTTEKNKDSGSKDYGEDLVGSRIKVWWPMDKKFYKGVVQSFQPKTKRHMIFYDDGEKENLALKTQKWEFVRSNSESEEEDADKAGSDSSSEIPQKKKAKTAEQSTKQAKMDISPKTGGGGSSSKAKGAAGSRKTDSKSKDKSKTVIKTEYDYVSSSEENKTAGKSKNEDGSNTSKSGKSKQGSVSTSKKSKQDSSSKSKQETPKPAKGRPPKSGGKSNGTGKLKPGSSSKVKKESEEEEEEDSKESSSSSSSDSDKEDETVKSKTPSSSKTQASKTKSGRKRRRSSFR